MSAMIDAAVHMAYLRRFFQGTGAVQSIWEDITCQSDQNEDDGAVVVINLNGGTEVPTDVIDELTEDCPPGVKILWLMECSVTEQIGDPA